MQYDEKITKLVVRSGIRTHAHRSGLRPERSALDHSAILTHDERSDKGEIRQQNLRGEDMTLAEEET